MTAALEMCIAPPISRLRRKQTEDTGIASRTLHDRRSIKVAHARAAMNLHFPVSDTVTVIIGHRLGKGEAVRRLNEGFARTNGHLRPMNAIEEQTWERDTLRFHMRALGQTATASIEVLEDTLRIELSLPWLLEKAAKHLLPILRKETTRLLEKK